MHYVGGARGKKERNGGAPQLVPMPYRRSHGAGPTRSGLRVQPEPQLRDLDRSVVAEIAALPRIGVGLERIWLLLVCRILERRAPCEVVVDVEDVRRIRLRELLVSAHDDK